MDVDIAPAGTGSVAGLTSAEIGHHIWELVAGCDGVYVKKLWHHGDLMYSLVRYDPGATTPGYPHATAEEHIWVVHGEAVIGGRRLPAGSYAHVPPRTPHPIRALGPWGCVLLRSHMPAHAASIGAITAASCQQ